MLARGDPCTGSRGTDEQTTYDFKSAQSGRVSLAGQFGLVSGLVGSAWMFWLNGR